MPCTCEHCRKPVEIDKSQCKACFQMLYNVGWYLKQGNHEEALRSAEMLVMILKTYEKSC